MQYDDKPRTRTQFVAGRVKRVVMRLLFRPLLKWSSLHEPETGYSLIIGVVCDLPGMLQANLAFVAKQRTIHLREIICVLDRPDDAITREIMEETERRYPELPVRFVTYTARQHRVLGWINWGWAYSWLSWSIGIATCRTRHAVLHDFDAMAIDPDFFENRYAVLLEKGVQYLGLRFYGQSGITPADRLVVTFEMFFDVAHVRSHHRPLDLFSKVVWRGGRAVDYDTFLYAQSRAGESDVMGWDAEALVHPSQVLCQFTEMGRDSQCVLPDRTSVPMVPYFLFAGGSGESMAALTECFENGETGTPRLMDRPMDLRQVPVDQVDWYVTQAERMERALVGAVRPEVARYFAALREYLSRD